MTIDLFATCVEMHVDKYTTLFFPRAFQLAALGQGARGRLCH